jgi:hypothetical protein
MVKASALYIVIIIALVIAVLCSSLVVSAYYYREGYQHKFRYDQLENNLASGINIVLESSDTAFQISKSMSLFGHDNDSVFLHQAVWGVYDIGTVRSFIGKDTLSRCFMIGHEIDSAKWAALYLSDNDRPLSVSGKTSIIGDAFLPKAGIQAAYVNGIAYTGSKNLLTGKKKASEKVLPLPDTARLIQLSKFFSLKGGHLSPGDSAENSFFNQVRVFNLDKNAEAVSGVRLKGNIVLRSDTTLTLDSSAKLDGILVCAPAIVVKAGFRGNCQLFAKDSISTGKNCHFTYPSCLGIIRFGAPPTNQAPAQINLGPGSSVDGLMFTHEAQIKEPKALMTLGKADTIRGMIYAPGHLQLSDSTRVEGGAFTSGFLYKSPTTLFENYLINVSLNEQALSRYFLGGEAAPATTQKKKVLKWLEKK